MYKILTLPGDGIGPEVMDATLSVLGWFGRKGLQFQTEEALVGGIAYETLGQSDPDETMAKAKAADVVLLGAVGGPQWDSKRPELRPEQGLLQIRQRLGLYCNLRPAKVLDALVNMSALKPARVKGTDIVIVRELMGGIYFGKSARNFYQKWRALWRQHGNLSRA